MPSVALARVAQAELELRSKPQEAVTAVTATTAQFIEQYSQELLSHLHAKQRTAIESSATEILYGGAAGGGKALDIRTSIATPSGWATMGDLTPGDAVYGTDGSPVRVLAVSGVMIGRPCFRLKFSDHSEIVADAQHEWLTYADGDPGGIVKTTESLTEDIRVEAGSRGRLIVSIERVESVPVRCIQVDATDHCYLAGPRMVPTHNSFLLRAAAIYHALRISHLQVYIFRRTHEELKSNHMEGARSLPEMLQPLVSRKLATINWSDLIVRFTHNGSIIKLCYCQYEKDVYRYHGAEIHLLLPDELTMLSASQYRYIRHRLRMANIEVPKGEEDGWPKVIAASNPGNIGHNWVREAWVSPAEPYEIWEAPEDDGGMRRQFIKAFLSDNPSISDPATYLKKLHGIGNPALVKAMAEGDWNIVSGAFLGDVWMDQVHILEPFEIPPGWRIDRSFDYGTSKPFSVGWWAESDGTEAVMRDGSRRSWPRGTVFRIREWYGWNGKANEGCRMGAKDIALGILDREREWGLAGRVYPGPADSSIFDVPPDEPSIATKFENQGVLWLMSDKSPGSRRAGGEEVRARLAAALQRIDHEDGYTFHYEPRNSPMEDPGLFFFSWCRNGAIRTLPTLPADASGEDADTHAEDHPYDDLRYRLTANKTKMLTRMSAGVPGWGG